MDNSIWGNSALASPADWFRVNPGSDPAKTALSEYYETPLGKREGPSTRGFSPRDASILTATASFGPSFPAATFASFDRRKCTGPLNEIPPQRASNARKVGPFIAPLAPASRT